MWVRAGTLRTYRYEATKTLPGTYEAHVYPKLGYLTEAEKSRGSVSWMTGMAVSCAAITASIAKFSVVQSPV